MHSSQQSSGFLKALGPGLMWAAAAIGVSHLVQSTRAGANYGFALVGIVLIANILKYPFFEFGPRYAAAKGESLLQGYRRLGKGWVVLFFILSLLTVFTIQAAVTVVTAALASPLTGIHLSPVTWSAILLGVCALLLVIGRFSLLDKLIKLIIILLTFSTVIAAIMAVLHGSNLKQGFEAPQLWDLAGFSFVVALVGWMPSAIDISVWHSIWSLERKKQTGHHPTLKQSLLDFNIGYFGTAILALLFLSLGAMVMYGSGASFSKSGSGFALQLIELYTSTLGEWSRPVILLAAFTTMFSTTLTCLDAIPRVLKQTTQLLFFPGNQDHDKSQMWLYWAFMLVVSIVALSLLTILKSGFTFMVDLATTLSFITAPVLSLMNYKVVTSPFMPVEAMPGRWLRIYSWTGILFASLFAIVFLFWKFIL